MIARLLIFLIGVLPPVSRWEAHAAEADLYPAATPPPQARVVIAEDPGATVAFRPQPAVIRSLVDRGVTALTGTPTPTEAWRALASTNQTLGLKVVSNPGPISGTRPVVVEAVIQSLLEAGWTTNRILIWDRQLIHLRLAGFLDLGDKYQIRVAASTDDGYDPEQFYESSFMGTLVWGDHEFGRTGPGVGRKSYVAKLVSQQMDRVISIAPLLNHNLVGVTGHLYSVAHGSVDNTVRFANQEAQLALAIPEIYALPVLGDRVVLNLTDALLAQYSGEQSILLHYSGILNQLRFSRDPVALDILSLKELERLRKLDGTAAVKADLTLYSNATEVEIGVSDPAKIQVETVRPER
ncbi:MAG: hypothetical protein ACYDC1_13925 [Limisphaerales bacterium]